MQSTMTNPHPPMGNPHMLSLQPHHMGAPPPPRFGMPPPNMYGGPGMCLPVPPPMVAGFSGGLMMGNSQMGGPPDMSAIGMTPVNLKKFKYLQPKAQDPSLLPSCTVYINNINDRVKLPELKENLRSMFKQFGEIREIFAMSSFWRRGQAWILFRDIESASAAISGMQGFIYHGQPLHINYSMNKSDLLIKEEGKPVNRPKGPKKPQAVRQKEERQRDIFLKLQQQYMQMQGVETGLNGIIPGNKTDAVSLVVAAQTRAAAAGGQDFRGKMESTGDSFLSQVPHKVLFVENLPDGCTNASLQSFFSNSEGLVDIRAILFKKVAFVEYASEALASKALKQLQNMTISGIPLRLSYARK